MFNLLLNSLSRFLPHEDVSEGARAWSNEDTGWHSSSFELAQGLEVIELRDPLFADTMPSCHLPLAQGMMAPGVGNAARS